MQTIYQTVDLLQPDPAVICQAADLLRQGEVVAFPTETVYGLGADALNPQAVAKIFLAKGRPSDNPLIVHIASREELLPLVGAIPPLAYPLMDQFWPGPLTMIFPKSPQVPLSVTAGLETVAIRMPSHPIALALLRQAGVPVAAPSANVSGRPSPTNGRHVWEDLDGRVAMVIDGGSTAFGLESTVLDLTQTPPMILRPGGVTLEEIRAVIGEVAVDQGSLGKGTVPLLVDKDVDHETVPLSDFNKGKDRLSKGADPTKTPRSPGMKYVHYAPKAALYILLGTDDDLGRGFVRTCRERQARGQKVALLVSSETARQMADCPADYLEILGSRLELSGVAHTMFAAFRHADAHGADVILIEGFAETGIGMAVMNRMRKAAGNNLIHC